MVNSVVGICDTNTVYMKKLAEYFMRKSGIPLQIMTFSEYGQLIQYLEKYYLDILITGGEICMEDLDQVCDMDAGMDTHQRKEDIRSHVKWGIELVDFVAETESVGGTLFKVSRYGSSAELLRLIERLISEGKNTETAVLYEKHNWEITGDIRIGAETCIERKNLKAKESSKKIVAIYSPVNRCGKTSLAVLFTQLLMRRGNSLMICMDHYSDIFSDEESNLAELIYCISRENNLRTEEVEHDFSEYEGFVKKWQDLWYIAAPRSVEDLPQISALQLCHLIDLLRHRSHYQYIVIDLSDGIEKLPLVLEQCDKIVVPFLEDCISRRKLDIFEQSMINVMGADEWILLSEKTGKVQLPETIEAENTENYYKELIWSDFGEFAGRLLDQYGL